MGMGDSNKGFDQRRQYQIGSNRLNPCPTEPPAGSLRHPRRRPTVRRPEAPALLSPSGRVLPRRRGTECGPGPAAAQRPGPPHCRVGTSELARLKPVRTHGMRPQRGVRPPVRGSGVRASEAALPQCPIGSCGGSGPAHRVRSPGPSGPGGRGCEPGRSDGHQSCFLTYRTSELKFETFKNGSDRRVADSPGRAAGPGPGLGPRDSN